MDSNGHADCSTESSIAQEHRSIVARSLRDIFARFLKHAKWLLLAIPGVSLVAAACDVAGPYIFSRLIDQLGSAQTAVIVGFGLYAALRGIAIALTYAVNFLSVVAAENLNYVAATSLFERLVRKSIDFFVDHNPAEIQAARENGERAIYTIAQLVLMVLVPGATQIAFSLLLLGVAVNSEIVAIVTVYGVAFIAATYFANASSRSLMNQAVRAGQENAKFIGGAIQAMEALRYFNADNWAAREFDRKADQIRSTWGRWARLRVTYAFVFGAALSAQLAVTFAVLLPDYQIGKLSVGDIVLINTLLIQLNRPFEMIGSAIDDLTRSWSRILPFARIWCAPEEGDPELNHHLSLQAGTIRFKAVSFRYGPFSGIDRVSFSAERGRLNFIVGETGSGKSTLFKLALKSLQPSNGRIEIDGIDLATLSRQQWYSVIGVVPQETILLNDTIATNIILGRSHDPHRLHHAVERACLSPFIDRQPDGLDTKVGERGLRISGGERQRIAIARALYAEPKVLFLDEASSALDASTESEIVAELRRIADDVTVIAITHRKTIIGPDDHVFALRNQVAEQPQI